PDFQVFPRIAGESCNLCEKESGFLRAWVSRRLSSRSERCSEIQPHPTTRTRVPALLDAPQYCGARRGETMRPHPTTPQYCGVPAILEREGRQCDLTPRPLSWKERGDNAAATAAFVRRSLR